MVISALFPAASLRVAPLGSTSGQPPGSTRRCTGPASCLQAGSWLARATAATYGLFLRAPSSPPHQFACSNAACVLEAYQGPSWLAHAASAMISSSHGRLPCCTLTPRSVRCTCCFCGVLLRRSAVDEPDTRHRCSQWTKATKSESAGWWASWQAAARQQVRPAVHVKGGVVAGGGPACAAVRACSATRCVPCISPHTPAVPPPPAPDHPHSQG
jgi:hypothetical protein